MRLNPLPFSIAIVGAVIYAGASVLGTLVLGRVTDKVLTPAFNGTGVSDSTTWSWVALIVGVSILRAIGTVTRRYFAGQDHLARAGLAAQLDRRPLPRGPARLPPRLVHR